MDFNQYEQVQINPGLIVPCIIFCVILCTFALVVSWKLFEKAGIAGWKCLIPIYNIYCLFKLAWGKGWMFLLLFVPIVNFVIIIMFFVKLAHAFDKGTGFAIGLIFLSIIFEAILAFDPYTRYIGPDGLRV